MPYISITTNSQSSDNDQVGLIKELSQKCSAALSKPEDYMSVSISPASHMAFGGEAAAMAFVELRAISLSDEAPKNLSPLICDIVSNFLKINKDRIYINFINVERSNWGWDSKTFE